MLGVLRGLGLDRLITARPSRLCELAVAMIAARIVAPRSKLAAARGLSEDTLSCGLGEPFALGDVDEDELYQAMDWLLDRQGRIKRRLAERHLEDGALVLYDVTSTWLEGRCCPLARHGYTPVTASAASCRSCSGFFALTTGISSCRATPVRTRSTKFCYTSSA